MNLISYTILRPTLLLLFMMISLTGCAQPTSSPQQPVEVPTQPALRSDLTTLGIGDEINVQVFRNTDLNRDVKIDNSGRISLPLIGLITAANLTPRQLEDAIEAKLSKYLVTPQVDVNVSNMKSRQYNVLGEVRLPGSFPLQRETLVFEAIANAGGFTNDANREDALLIRSENGKAVICAVNLDLENNSQDVSFAYLADRDIIYIPKSTIADVELFMKRLSNIIRPIIDIEWGIILGKDAADVIAGKPRERSIIINQ